MEYGAILHVEIRHAIAITQIHTSEESLRIMSRRRGRRARRKGDGQGAGDNAALRFLKEQATPCYTTDPPTLAGVTREKGASTRRHARVGPGR